MKELIYLPYCNWSIIMVGERGMECTFCLASRIFVIILNPEAYLEPYQISKKEFFAKIVDSFQLLITLTKCALLDVLQDSEI